MAMHELMVCCSCDVPGVVHPNAGQCKVDTPVFIAAAGHDLDDHGQDCVDRARRRMSQLGYTADEITKAETSNAVFDHSAATFNILLTSECRMTHAGHGHIKLGK
jgi:hypothetical protein